MGLGYRDKFLGLQFILLCMCFSCLLSHLNGSQMDLGQRSEFRVVEERSHKIIPESAARLRLELVGATGALIGPETLIDFPVPAGVTRNQTYLTRVASNGDIF